MDVKHIIGRQISRSCRESQIDSLTQGNVSTDRYGTNGPPILSTIGRHLIRCGTERSGIYNLYGVGFIHDPAIRSAGCYRAVKRIIRGCRPCSDRCGRGS